MTGLSKIFPTKKVQNLDNFITISCNPSCKSCVRKLRGKSYSTNFVKLVLSKLDRDNTGKGNCTSVSLLQIEKQNLNRTVSGGIWQFIHTHTHTLLLLLLLLDKVSHKNRNDSTSQCRNILV